MPNIAYRFVNPAAPAKPEPPFFLDPLHNIMARLLCSQVHCSTRLRDALTLARKKAVAGRRKRPNCKN